MADEKTLTPEEAADETVYLIKTIEAKAGATKDQLEKLKTDVSKMTGKEYIENAEFKSFMEKVTARLDEIDKIVVKSQRPNIETATGIKDEEKARLFMKYIHYGMLQKCGSDYAPEFALSEKELKHFDQKDLSVTREDRVQVAGGFEQKAAMATNVVARAGALVGGPEWVREILDTSVREKSTIRQYATVKSTSKEAYEQPKKTAHAVAYFPVGETGAVTEDTTLAYGTEKIEIFRLNVLFKYTRTQLEDTEFDLFSEITTEGRDAINAAEGEAFVNGTATGEPEGYLYNSSVSSVNQGEAAAITNAVQIIQMPYGLKDIYAKNGKFFMRRATMGTLAALLDGSGQFLNWTLQQKAGYSLAGYEVIPTPDMPAIGANTYPIVFGDMKYAYKVIDKKKSEFILIDPYTYGTTEIVQLIIRKRVGGQCVIPEALYKLKIATP